MYRNFPYVISYIFSYDSSLIGTMRCAGVGLLGRTRGWLSSVQRNTHKKGLLRYYIMMFIFYSFEVLAVTVV